MIELIKGAGASAGLGATAGFPFDLDLKATSLVDKINFVGGINLDGMAVGSALMTIIFFLFIKIKKA